MSVNESVELARESTWSKPGSLDEYITGLCLNRTIGDVNRLRETATNARAFFGASLVWNSIWGADGKFNPDINSIKQIIERIVKDDIWSVIQQRYRASYLPFFQRLIYVLIICAFVY